MKKRILHICTGLILASAMILPSCELLQECGNCTLVLVDNQQNITYGTPQFVCGETYLGYKDSEITTTVDGQQYWDCE